MSSLDDFLAAFPVPQPPPGEEPPRDTALDAMAETTSQHAARTPMGGRRTMEIVSRAVCRFPCTDHDHSEPEFRPQPDLDEIGVGWTVQHTPKDPNRHKVPQRCVLCWTEVPDLREHECQVAVVISG